MRKLTFALLIIICTLSIFSCKDCEPVNQPGNQLILKFYRLDSLLASGNKVSLDTLFEKVSGAGNDSILYDNTATNRGSSFLLPLSGFSTSSSFIFQTSPTQSDTISFQYVLKVNSEGPDCGFFEEFSEIQLLTSTFDSAQLVKENIAIGDIVHIEVFE